MECRNYLYDHVLPNEAAEWGGLLFVNWPLRVRQLWLRVGAVMSSYIDAHCAQLNLYTTDDFKHMGSLSL